MYVDNSSHDPLVPAQNGAPHAKQNKIKFKLKEKKWEINESHEIGNKMKYD